MMDFDGKVAVITGAASGIGAGLARKALSLGMRVVLADVREPELTALAATLGGEVLTAPTDVADPESVEALADKAYENFGAVDLLFNNAGIMATGFSWTIEPERWRRSVDVNFFGVLHGVRSFVPRMLKAGTKAHIVNTSSVGGFLASPLMAPYSVTKFAIVALTESLRAEFEIIKAPIGVSLLAPGPVKTGIFNDPFGAMVEPGVQSFVDDLRSMLTAYGLTGDQFAELVFAGIAADQFWIIPQPEAFDEAYRRRADDVLARRTPRLPRLE
jgi:NAD(P)-dependent dehydrogenase (short-subunit alcohol dehydrogenase family)